MQKFHSHSKFVKKRTMTSNNGVIIHKKHEYKSIVKLHVKFDKNGGFLIIVFICIIIMLENA